MKTIRLITGVAILLTAFSATAAEIVVPYFLSASDPNRQSFVRIIWPYTNDYTLDRGATIRAYDDAGNRYPPIEIELPEAKLRNGTIDGVFVIYFNSDDLEYGNANKHIPYGTGSGRGDWWLKITSDEAIIVQSFIRTSDGFLTSMHDVLPKKSNGTMRNSYEANTFNPASNTNQVSSLRIVNTSNEKQTIMTNGAIDTEPHSEGSALVYHHSIKPYQAVNLTAQFLEENSHPNAQWSEKRGKRRIVIWSRTDHLLDHLLVMHIMETPTGHITNLSTQMGFDARYAPWPREEATSNTEPEPQSDSFDMTLRFNSDVPQSVENSLMSAAARWERVITEGLPAQELSLARNDCRNPSSINEEIDDLLVFVDMRPLNSVGRAAPCITNIWDAGGVTTRVGWISVNSNYTSNWDTLDSRGFDKVMLHELGHVLGFYPQTFQDADVVEYSPDTRFTGEQAVAEFQRSRYSRNYDGVDVVPLESNAGHWRREAFTRGAGHLVTSELMAPAIADDAALSAVTIAALQDLGYRVDFSQADRVSSATQEDRIRIDLRGDVY